METLTVTLSPYGHQQFVLPKAWILTALPNSLFASTLEVDPQATELPIQQAVVTPDVMQLLVDLSQGREPTHHNSNLIAADRYLGIPGVLYYADPAYDMIPNRLNGNAPENKQFIYELLRQDRLWPFAYLIAKGYVPTDGDFSVAARNGSVDIVNWLLNDPRIASDASSWHAYNLAVANGKLNIVKLFTTDPRVQKQAMRHGFEEADENSLSSAAERGDIEMVKYLLAPPKKYGANSINQAISSAAGGGYYEILKLLLARKSDYPKLDIKNVSLAANHNQPLINAVKNGHADIVDFILKDPTVNPADQNNKAIQLAAINGYVDIVKALLADPRVNPGAFPDIFWPVIDGGHADVVALLLADGRADPTWEGNSPIWHAHREGEREIVRLLLADPRVRQSLSPEELYRYTPDD